MPYVGYNLLEVLHMLCQPVQNISLNCMTLKITGKEFLKNNLCHSTVAVTNQRGIQTLQILIIF